MENSGQTIVLVQKVVLQQIRKELRSKLKNVMKDKMDCQNSVEEFKEMFVKRVLEIKEKKEKEIEKVGQMMVEEMNMIIENYQAEVLEELQEQGYEMIEEIQKRMARKTYIDDQLDRVDTKINEVNRWQDKMGLLINQQQVDLDQQLKNQQEQVQQLISKQQDDMKLLVQKQQGQMQKQQNRIRQFISQGQQIDDYDDYADILEFNLRIDQNKLKFMRELQRLVRDRQNTVQIEDAAKIDDYKKQIEQYQQKGQQYAVMINFYQNNTTLEEKMQILKAVDELKVKERVGGIGFKLDKDNPIDEQIIKTLLRKNYDLFVVIVLDQNDQIDQKSHDLIQQLIKRMPALLTFALFFMNGKLSESEESFQLLKSYNKLMRHQEYLEGLAYRHSKIQKQSEEKEKTMGVMEEVDKM